MAEVRRVFWDAGGVLARVYFNLVLLPRVLVCLAELLIYIPGPFRAAGGKGFLFHDASTLEYEFALEVLLPPTQRAKHRMQWGGASADFMSAANDTTKSIRRRFDIE